MSEATQAALLAPAATVESASAASAEMNAALAHVEGELKDVRDQLVVLWEREKVLAKARRGLRTYIASQRPEAGERRG